MGMMRRLVFRRPRRPRRRTAWLATLSGLALVALWIAAWQPRFAIDVVAAANPEILYRVETDDKVVALTIDDGPSAALTADVLAVLAEHDARATFFLIGSRAREHPELVARIRAAGHEVGNHMMRDRPTVFQSDERFARELERTEGILGLDGPGKLFRPPSSWIRGGQLDVLTRRGYTCCLGSVYPHDTKHGHVGLSAWFVLAKVRPGDVVILHEGSEGRREVVEVLRMVLPELTRRGYRVVGVGEMVGGGR